MSQPPTEMTLRPWHEIFTLAVGFGLNIGLGVLGLATQHEVLAAANFGAAGFMLYLRLCQRPD